MMSSCLLDFCEHLLHGSQKSAACISYMKFLCSKELVLLDSGPAFWH